MMLFQIFLAFARIGLLAFGGGFAALALIEKILISELNWLSLSEFLDVVAISQLTPGSIAVGAATYVGYKLCGFWGAAVATIGVCLPPVIIMLVVIRFLKRFETNVWVNKVIRGLRPAVIALIAFAAFSIAVGGNGITDIRGIIIAVVSFILIKSRKIDPVLVLLLAGASGIAAYL